MVVYYKMIPCYVIHVGQTFPNKEALDGIGLDPIGFKGVDARKDEHLQYSEYIENSCQFTCPKTAIGCGLSHVLLAEKLYDEGYDTALVLEDDAYPFQTIDFESVIQTVPDDWEIIKLHCDTGCMDGSHSLDDHGSTAAYIINRKGMLKLKDTKVRFHIDYQIAHMSDIVSYKSLHNLFWTDESNSINREKDSVHWLSYFFKEPTSGEKKNYHKLSYKIIRIPGTDVEFSTRQIIDGVLILACVLFFVYKFS